MPPTVLGKRARPLSDDADTQTRSTRSRRRLVVNAPNDENQNPFVRQERADVDEESKKDRTNQKNCKPQLSTSVPAKHGIPGERVNFSPSKITPSRRTRKSPTKVFEDAEATSLPTPKTPRHRDSQGKKLPITPRHRVLTAGSSLAPRTPRTPGTSLSSVYQPVRKLFSRCCAPGRLVGRDQERTELTTFIESALGATSGGCMYVSGPPGTGKSTLVDEVIGHYRDSDNIGISAVNCMSIRKTKDLGSKLCEDLGFSEDSGFTYLRKCFGRRETTSSQKYIVILDEIDRLADLDLSLLYDLFEWSMQDSSRLILIGIANALDLTDRLLPRLKGRNLKPQLLPFMPYTAAQIAEVVVTKLKSLSSGDDAVLPFLHPAAIQFCAKKVAAQTGDLRKAFDICRRAIDLIESETREKLAEGSLQTSPSRLPLMENINLSSPSTSETSAKPIKSLEYTSDTAPKATIAHVAKVTAQVFGNGVTQRLNTLNLQQKAVLCALSALERHRRNTQIEHTVLATPSKNNATAPTIKQLFEAYNTLCRRDNLFHPLTSGEFRDVVAGLETLSLVSRADGKGTGSFVTPITPSRTPGRKPKNGFGSSAIGDERRVASAFGVQELSASLDGPGGELLREMLEGDVSP